MQGKKDVCVTIADWHKCQLRCVRCVPVCVHSPPPRRPCRLLSFFPYIEPIGWNFFSQAILSSGLMTSPTAWELSSQLNVNIVPQENLFFIESTKNQSMRSLAPKNVNCQPWPNWYWKSNCSSCGARIIVAVENLFFASDTMKFPAGTVENASFDTSTFTIVSKNLGKMLFQYSILNMLTLNNFG